MLDLTKQKFKRFFVILLNNVSVCFFLQTKNQQLPPDNAFHETSKKFLPFSYIFFCSEKAGHTL